VGKIKGMGEEKNLITKEIKKIYSIILLIFTSMLILCTSFVTSTFRLFLDYLIWHVNYKVISETSNYALLNYENFTFFVLKLSSWLLILIVPFEILSKNKKINIIIYLFLIGIYIGILTFINLYLVNIGMVIKVT